MTNVVVSSRADQDQGLFLIRNLLQNSCNGLIFQKWLMRFGAEISIVVSIVVLIFVDDDRDNDRDKDVERRRS